MRRGAYVAVVLALAVPAPGWCGDGVVALQTAAPSCADESRNRYVPCGNGTVTDNRTGLVWLANADCFGLLDWFEAMAAVAGLSDLSDDAVTCTDLTPDQCDCGLSDGSSPGEWRLPSIEEWEVMIEEVFCNGPRITDDTGAYCWVPQCVDQGSCSFYGVQVPYWSSSTWLTNPADALSVDLSGYLLHGDKGGTRYVWPVRGGQ